MTRLLRSLAAAGLIAAGALAAGSAPVLADIWPPIFTSMRSLF